METALRFFLLLLGALIVLGIIWDLRKNRQALEPKSAQAKRRTVVPLQKSHFMEGTEPFLEGSETSFEDSVLSTEANDPWAAEDSILGATAETCPDLSVLRHEENDTGQVIALHIWAKEPAVFSGRDLLTAFKQNHLHYGNRNIFHRQADPKKQGAHTQNPILFSVLSLVEPGFFELSNMAQMRTPGIALFFILQPNSSVATFDLMLHTAQKLAAFLNGDLCNDQNIPLSAAMIQDYRKRCRLYVDSLIPF